MQEVAGAVATRPEVQGNGRSRRWWVEALLALLVARTVATAAVTAVALARHRGVLGAWVQWDSAFYLQAARAGWPHHVDPHAYNTTAFFPGLPLVIRAVHVVVRGWRAAGLVADGLLQVAMALALGALLREVLPVWVRRRCLWAVMVFPGAYVLAQVYSEPLFIACAALCLLALHRARRTDGPWWVAAGVAAAAGGATRPTGIALVACCAWAAGAELRRRRAWRALAAPLLAPAGLVAYLAFLAVRTGSDLSYVRTQDDAWQQRPTLAAIPQQVSATLHGHSVDALYLVMLAGGVVALGLLVSDVRSRALPAEWLVYAAICFATTLASAHVGFRPRFALTAFPLVVACARRLRPPAVAPALGASLAGLAVLGAATSAIVP